MDGSLHIGPPTTGREVATRVGDLYVREVGAGRPAVLWHSLFVDSTTWQRVVPDLARERRMVLIDAPGQGRSPAARRPYGLDDCADAARDVLDHLGVDEPVDWLGNAWGGHVGLLFAAGRPEQCRSLVAVGTPIHPLEPAARRQMRMGQAVYRVVGPVRPLARMVSDALLGRGADVQDARIVTDAFRRADRAGMVAAMDGSFSRPDLAPALASVRTPTVLVAAADDPLCTPAAARAAAAHLPAGAAVVLPGGGHVGPLLQSAPLLVETVTAVWHDPAGFVAAHRELSTPPVS
jgi:pimeloyl-ACP methyl ester carboxylesterase